MIYWQFVIPMTTFTVALWAGHEIFRRYLRATSVMFVAVAVTLPIWLHNVDDWFRLAKILSVVVPICFLNQVRLSHRAGELRWPMFRKNWVFVVLHGVVIVNIIQLCLKDFTLGNYFNAFAGILVCVMTERAEGWRVDRSAGGKADILADTPILWCLLYSSWVACFVYAENPAYLAHVLCILAVPIFYSLSGRCDLWFSARAYTLAVSLVIRGSYDFITPIMNSAAWFNAEILNLWGCLNLLFAVGYIAYYFAQKPRTLKSNAID